MEQTVTLPEYAQKHIREIQAQQQALQAQMQSFIDGVLCGMGADMTAQISVDMQSMTATIKGGGDKTPALEEAGE